MAQPLLRVDFPNERAVEAHVSKHGQMVEQVLASQAEAQRRSSQHRRKARTNANDGEDPGVNDEAAKVKVVAPSKCRILGTSFEPIPIDSRDTFAAALLGEANAQSLWRHTYGHSIGRINMLFLYVAVFFVLPLVLVGAIRKEWSALHLIAPWPYLLALGFANRKIV